MRQPVYASAGADRRKAKGALLVLTLILHAPAALALGLGPLRVKSALDQPLRAEIELSGVQEAELRTLEVALARKDEFAKAGVSRADHLLQLKFEIAQAADGRRIVQLSSKKAIKEPFLQFVVAAQWSGGRVVREYTALLDPPLYGGDKPTPVSTPKVVADEAARPSAAPAGPAAKPVKPIVGGPVGEPAAPAKEVPGRELLPAGGPAGRTAEYGPVEKGDTLWDIASQLDSGGAQVNIFQVLIALFRENPEAFVNGNINRLKKGAILRIGNVDSIAAISRKEASRIYQAQLEEWLAYRGKVAQGSTLTKMPDARVEPKAAASGEKSPAGQVAAAAAQTVKPAEKREAKEAPKEAAKATAPELRIVQAPTGAPAGKERAKAADAAAVTLGLKNQVGTLEEALAARERENLELRERVALLETQIKNATRLVQIESQQLAQGQQASQQKAAAETEKAPVAGAVATPPAPEAATAAKPSEAPAAPAEPAKVAEAPKAQPETPKPAEEPKKVEEPATVAPPPKAAEAPKPAVAPTARPAETKIRVEATKPAAPGFLDNVFGFLSDSISGWTLGGIGAMAAVLGGLMYYRRRRSLAEFQESVLMGGQGPTTTTASEPNPTRTDTSFLSDFGLGGVNVQADEVDPLAEAEVYLAYGRDEQAEEVLRDAAGRNPNRLELKTKLLEIYKQRKDVKAFETLAEELYPASGKGDPEVWKKVAAMGREVNPENPLFAMELPVDAFERKDIFRAVPERAAPAKTAVPAAAASTAPTAKAAPLPALEVPVSTAADEITLAAPHDEDLDLGLDSFDKADKAGGDELLDFDWETDKPAVISPAQPKFDDFSLELPGRGDEEFTPAPALASEAPKVQTGAPAVRSEFDFDALESPTVAAPVKPDTAWPELAPETAAAPAGESAKPSWALEPDAELKPASHLETPPVTTEDALAWDEAATKLELARAYLDMGDKVGARSILDEVLKEGNPAQQGQAKTLVAQLSA